MNQMTNIECRMSKDRISRIRASSFVLRHSLPAQRSKDRLVPTCQFSEGGQYVNFGQCFRRCLKPRGGGGNQFAQFDKQVEFALLEFVLGGEDFLFVLLELRRYVAFGVF